MTSFANSRHLFMFPQNPDYTAHPPSGAYSERALLDDMLFEEQGKRQHYHSYSTDPRPLTSQACFPHGSMSFQQESFQDYQAWPEYHYDHSRGIEHHRFTARHPSELSTSLSSPKFDGAPALIHGHHSTSSALQLTSNTSPYLSESGSSHRPSLAGSLDPATGIFYRTPEHPRLRTAQACEKCRTRKAKCSGEHPSCKRCLSRGLICQYAKEGRVRGPNKPKAKLATSPAAAESGPVNLESPPAQKILKEKPIPPEDSLSRHSMSPNVPFFSVHHAGLNFDSRPSSTTPPTIPISAVSITPDHYLEYHPSCHSSPTADSQLSEILGFQALSGHPPFQHAGHTADNFILRTSEYSHRSQPSLGLQVIVPSYEDFQNVVYEATSAS
ncbi:hypothetical protein L218DRAFT_993742 [Marasmius fiardii PR-910]|nr:hypothetical protein L218DRAFT_993742 [Marasmius fiardii PR-910]